MTPAGVIVNAVLASHARRIAMAWVNATMARLIVMVEAELVATPASLIRGDRVTALELRIARQIHLIVSVEPKTAWNGPRRMLMTACCSARNRLMVHPRETC